METMKMKFFYNVNSYIKYLVLSILLVMIVMYSHFFKTIFKLNYFKEEIIHGIILDAGSTGTRIHVYNFLNVSSRSPPLFLGEIFKEIEPGLSSFAHNVKHAITTLYPLLHLAKLHIPHFKWNYTLIQLKATAGLRLLPSIIKNEIIYEVHKLLAKYPFKRGLSHVSVISGEEEGIMAWATINYLLGNWNLCENFVGGIDLGGASFQITTHMCNQVSSRNIEYKQIDYFGNKYKLYTSSFLGYGLMAARYIIFGGHINETSLISTLKTNYLKSFCLNYKYTGDWDYQGTQLVVKGQPFNSAIFSDRFSACHSQIKEALNGHSLSFSNRNLHPFPQKFQSMLNNDFYLFSYFFDRAQQAQLVSSHAGSPIKIGHYCHMAVQVCNQSFMPKPFMCMDLTYICILLVDYLGFHPNQTVMVAKKINNTEISWSLGSALQMMNLVSYE